MCKIRIRPGVSSTGTAMVLDSLAPHVHIASVTQRSASVSDVHSTGQRQRHAHEAKAGARRAAAWHVCEARDERQRAIRATGDKEGGETERAGRGREREAGN